MRYARLDPILTAVVVSCLLLPATASARELAFEDRVAAQEAIERVYHSHQIGARRTFEQAVPRQVLERRVRTYLAQSVALERVWHTPVTAEALRLELTRIAERSRMPERLLELFAALDHDPFLIQECLVRPVLVGRLARNFFDSDERDWDRWWAELASEAGATTVEAVADEGLLLPQVARGEGPPCEADLWDNGILDDGPTRRSGHTTVWTGSEMIVWGGSKGGNATGSGERYQPATDSWTSISTEGGPGPRENHTAVWTGELMIIWGDFYSRSGGRYDPTTDSWSPTSLQGAPEGRFGFSAVWTGEEMIVWGGFADGGVIFDNGGRYDPDGDSWTPVSTFLSPSARGNHTAVWTGSWMVVWGGYGGGELNDGGRYDPVSDSWLPLGNTGAPLERHNHTAVWTGTEMIVWGGKLAGGTHITGGRYSFATGWSPMTTVGAPERREDHTAVWTGEEMIVWGGYHNGTLGSGGRYDPSDDSWTPVTESGAPIPRRYHSTVWTGERMIVWGGRGAADEFGAHVHGTGGRYDPDSDSWTPTYSPGAPDGRAGPAGVWTGNEMIVWGGGYVTGGDGIYVATVDTGGRYDPATDSWASTATANAPESRFRHTAVWTGDEMIVWGGGDDFVELSTGSRYDPIADSWAATTTVSAPTARVAHTAIWTGDEMIIWGGDPQGSDGKRYDPDTNTWAPMSSVDAPPSRYNHTAVWTGTNRMIVWGGYWQGNRLNSGARYDLATDTWTPVSLDSAPTGRDGHTAIWTGSRMVVWGGRESSAGVNTGGRYDPIGDSWQPTSTDQAPSGRNGHTAIWTGSRMVVWAGQGLATGGRYDPVGDTWESTSLVDAPPGRWGHQAVWTGDTMYAWGGWGITDTGGGYRPHGADADGDGHTCDLDCNDSDPGAFAVPGEVGLLSFDSDKRTLRWPSAAQTSGTATVYDIVRGSLDELPVGSGSETCVESNYSAVPDGITGLIELGLETTPPLGTGEWYLVRAANSCGEGPYGSTSFGAPRTTTTCP